ncbi:MAG: 2-oxo acid dehydrogenase subunit E2 [Spirochaetaceae bacterium]|jgi:pyruvate/2-oxoglutarate dehydrogenase complex dihydrolipoamide acyltransferase (E2) component|nr:2-oxo acid dehydrogenase subunit E2 [Spirochaetaceae bacterium]
MSEQSKITEIPVPVENVNDESVQVAEFLVPDLSPVNADDEILTIETSKAAINITSPATGFVHFLVQEKDEVPVGSVLAIVADTIEILQEYQGDTTFNTNSDDGTQILPNDTKVAEKSYLRVTKAAAELLQQYNTNAEKLGLTGLVRAEDVKAAIEKREVPKLCAFASPRENIVSKTKKTEIQLLSEAKSEVILSQVSVLVPTKGIFTKAAKDGSIAKQFSARIIFEVSRLLQQYPSLQSMYQNGALYQYTETHIGYALNIEKGLKVPVFKDCNKMNLDDILRQKDTFIEKYISNTLTMAEMSGGTFTITDLSSGYAWLFNPVLNTGQSAILGIGGENPQGNCYPLILAFDHRVSDGQIAAAFLNDLKKRLIAHEQVLCPAVLPISKESHTEEHKDTQRKNDETTENRQEDLPCCSKCYRDVDELTAMDQYLVQTIDRNGDTQLVCTICMEGW